MKVNGSGRVGQAGGSRPGRAASGDGFRLPSAGEAGGPAQAAGVATPATVMGVDALLTLQDIGGPLERRKRAVGRGGRLLDVLDRLKIALLAGELSTADLERLQRTLTEQRPATGDPRLEDLLDEIETRAAVELAKLQAARAA
jgi:hypothetical protein